MHQRQGGAYFSGATFAGITTFQNSTFKKGANFSRIVIEKDFGFLDVNMDNPLLVKFHNATLSKCSFIGGSGMSTILRHIDFNDIEWASKSNRPLSKRSAVICDEILNDAILRQRHDRKTRVTVISALERLYRDLRLNFEGSGQYSDAGEFYISEMEMKLMRSLPFRPQWWLLQYFRIMCGYGERYIRALTCLILLILFFGMCFMFIGFADVDYQIYVKRYWNQISFNPSDVFGTMQDFFVSGFYALKSLNLLHAPNISYYNFWGKVVEVLIAIFGLTQLALFVLALKRNFKR